MPRLDESEELLRNVHDAGSISAASIVAAG